VARKEGIPMEKFERILVPLDGSDCAEMVLPKVEKLAKDLKASVALLRVAIAHTFPGADPTDAEVKVVREALQADVLINIPIFKQHNYTRVTGCLKNLMGMNYDNPSFHPGDLYLHQAIEANPEILLLDESFTLLSLEGRKEIVNFLKEVNKKNNITM
jgi:nucleotide-binding universal stress UspA family protein